MSRILRREERLRQAGKHRNYRRRQEKSTLRENGSSMPEKTVGLSRTEFYRRLGISPQFYYRLRADGFMPPPPRLTGSRFIVYSESYLQACRKALDDVRRLDQARRRLTRRKVKELIDADLL